MRRPSRVFELRLVIAVLATLSLVPTLSREGTRAASPPGPYAVTDLGILGTVQSAHANGINEAGQVVGNSGSRPFLWQDGAMTDLTTVAGNKGGASDINEAGQIAGSSTITPTSSSHPVIWENGTMTDLMPGSTDSSTAAAINDAGDVVGSVNYYASAFLWKNGVITDLGQLGGGCASASDINNAGQIVGSSCSPILTQLGFMQHPFIWQNGTMTDLGLLPDDEDGGAAAINDLGQIVGSSGRTDPETYETTYRAFLYENGVMTALPVPSFDAYAGDINDAGVVVGTMRAGGGFSKWHAWIYADGVVTDLNSLIPSGSGLHLLYAYAVNNAGQIVGVAYDAQARYHAYLLTPIAPGTSIVNIGDASVTEGNSGTRSTTFTLTLSAASGEAVTVSYGTGNGSATAGSDYQSASGIVTFGAGETTKTVSVVVNGDRDGEPNETFLVNLSHATGGAVIGDAQGTGTIVDDEPRVSVTSVTKNEGNSGTTPFVFTVSLSAASDIPVSVNFATSPGSAKSPEDFETKSGTLNFAVGETSKTVTVYVNGDRIREGQEYFGLHFPSASGAVIPQNWGYNVYGTGAIKNDDR